MNFKFYKNISNKNILTKTNKTLTAIFLASTMILGPTVQASAENTDDYMAVYANESSLAVDIKENISAESLQKMLSSGNIVITDRDKDGNTLSLNIDSNYLKDAYYESLHDKSKVISGNFNLERENDDIIIEYHKNISKDNIPNIQKENGKAYIDLDGGYLTVNETLIDNVNENIAENEKTNITSAAMAGVCTLALAGAGIVLVKKADKIAYNKRKKN